MVGSVLAVSSGLPVGKEGPLLHIGACVAAFIGDKGFFCGLVKMRGDLSEQFFMNTDTRDLVVCGTAAGVAAAFKAPVRSMLGGSSALIIRLPKREALSTVA